MKPSKNNTALIIDDESDICFLLTHILEQKNIHTVHAGSLEETDKILNSTDNIGYIFLDNNLPDGMGIFYISKIKSKFPNSRIIMISAHDSNEYKHTAKENGADQFIGKPFSKEVILNTLDKYQA